MPRRTASQRHAERPSPEWPPQNDAALLAAIVAINHPVRRALYEALDGGSADVGTLAGRTGIAPGSASHHLNVLATAGWIEASPDAARDTRHTVWRSLGRSLSWSSDDLGLGTRGRRIADDLVNATVHANHEVLIRAMRNPQSRASVTLSDWHTKASDAQCRELDSRILAVVAQWRAEVEASPEDSQRPRRIVMWNAPLDGPKGAS